MIKEVNSCYTYFAIKGDFDPNEISALLGLSPFKQWRIGDKRRYGTGLHDFANWEYGLCDEYDVDVSNQMMKTIADLTDKVEILKEIKKKYDAYFYLEIVPQIYAGDITPCISPKMDIIKFCYETETHIDIDYYIYEHNLLHKFKRAVYSFIGKDSTK